MEIEAVLAVARSRVRIIDEAEEDDQHTAKRPRSSSRSESATAGGPLTELAPAGDPLDAFAHQTVHTKKTQRNS